MARIFAVARSQSGIKLLDACRISPLSYENHPPVPIVPIYLRLPVLLDVNCGW